PRPNDPRKKYKFNPKNGFSFIDSNRIFCVSKLNGKPLPNEEMSILVQPGEKIVLEFFLPHSPIPYKRAFGLFKQSFDKRLEVCKEFWGTKLDKAVHIYVPEKRIEEMIKAGLLQLDLTTFGLEPSGTLTPTIGVYSAIGTESAPIMQFYM